ncbi:MAG: ABC transporter ATP-binding protein [Alphaproteobacteria bacterium]|jgi:branched-chain amino acid transport system ATP-binding protein|nr:ABC transporter ATP-binding protein [Alphaproteobacteria bacterium]
MTAALELAGIHKSFGATEIIRGVDLAVTMGERHAIIGPNGAGKSTLYNLITGRYEVTSGAIRLRGEEITNRKPYDINRMGLSRSFQVTNIFHRMTVFENIRCGALWSEGHRYAFWRLIGRQRDLTARSERILEQIGLAGKGHVPAAMLSYADQRALELGVTIAGGADVILLDEPTAGMSHSEIDNAVRLIRAVTKDKTLVIVEHDMGVVFDLADRISVLVYGEIIATDNPEKIKANPKVQEAYLGTEAA